MAHNEAEQKHIDALKKMSTAEVIMALIESVSCGMNRFKLDLAELDRRFVKMDIKFDE